MNKLTHHPLFLQRNAVRAGRLATAALLACISCAADAAKPAATPTPSTADDESLRIFRQLDDDVSALKKQALEINRDLLIVEEESFIPPSSQLVVFLSLRKQTLSKRGEVQVKLEVDNTVVANHSYTAEELNALIQGGMHRLYLGNLPVGPHTVTVAVDGVTRDNTTQRRAYEFSKAWSRKFVNITLEVPEKDGKLKVVFEEL